MKKVKGKYIRVTEEQLNSIIKESVEKQLKLIMEYAEPRRKFVEHVANLSYQIIENWCLVHYCTIINRTQSKEHWQKELLTHMGNLGTTSIKKNDSVEVRQKAIEEGFNVRDIFESPQRINKIIGKKFIIEDIDYQSDEVKKVCADCFDSLKDIINLIANFDPSETMGYIKSI